MTGGILLWKLSPSMVQPSAGCLPTAHVLLGSGMQTLYIIS